MKSLPKVPPAALARYDALIATIPGLLRKGATSAYTSKNGNMFSFMTAEGALALRLPAADRTTFLAKHKNAVCISYGVVMKEYVLVPDAMLRNNARARELFSDSYAYVCSLKAKPTTRPKKTATVASVKAKPAARSAKTTVKKPSAKTASKAGRK